MLAVTSKCSTLQRINHYMIEEAIEWDVLYGGRERKFPVTVSLYNNGNR
jgi:hypothetical protein